MKLNAKIDNIILDNHNTAHLNLLVSNYRQAHELVTLDNEKLYTVELKEVKSKRSIESNRLLWKLLGELEKHSDIGLMTWYISALQDADCKPTYLVGNEELYETIVMSFRAVEVVGKRMIVDDNGKETEGVIYKCYVGSSKFTTKEMTRLIDVVLGYCAELGINTDLLNYE